MNPHNCFTCLRFLCYARRRKKILLILCLTSMFSFSILLFKSQRNNHGPFGNGLEVENVSNREIESNSNLVTGRDMETVMRESNSHAGESQNQISNQNLTMRNKLQSYSLDVRHSDFLHQPDDTSLRISRNRIIIGKRIIVSRPSSSKENRDIDKLSNDQNDQLKVIPSQDSRYGPTLHSVNKYSAFNRSIKEIRVKDPVLEIYNQNHDVKHVKHSPLKRLSYQFDQKNNELKGASVKDIRRNHALKNSSNKQSVESNKMAILPMRNKNKSEADRTLRGRRKITYVSDEYQTMKKINQITRDNEVERVTFSDQDKTHLDQINERNTPLRQFLPNSKINSKFHHDYISKESKFEENSYKIESELLHHNPDPVDGRPMSPRLSQPDKSINKNEFDSLNLVNIPPNVNSESSLLKNENITIRSKADRHASSLIFPVVGKISEVTKLRKQNPLQLDEKIQQEDHLRQNLIDSFLSIKKLVPKGYKFSLINEEDLQELSSDSSRYHQMPDGVLSILEPDISQFSDEQYNTPPASACCESNPHHLPYNQRNPSDYQNGKIPTDNSVEDTDLVNSAEEKNFQDMELDPLKRDRLQERDQNVSTIDANVIDKDNLSYLENEIIIRNDRKDDPRKIGGGRWINDVWESNTLFATTNSFYFVTST